MTDDDWTPLGKVLPGPTSDDELDAMTADEAKARCCYIAWLHRRDYRNSMLMANAIDKVREQAWEGLRQHRCDDPECKVCEWNRAATRHQDPE